MVIACGRDDTGRPLLILGLESVNITKLKEGRPILRDLKEFGLPDFGTVMILCGDTPEAIQDELRNRGMELPLVADYRTVGPS